MAPQHALSASRIVLGAVVLNELRAARASAGVLPAVVCACMADYADGIVARRLHAESTAGRLLDNLCDAVFLGLAFAGLAAARIWTASSWAGEVPWARMDWFPLVALVGSFGTYLLRWRAAHARGATPRPSARGHHAGIANYGLALVGAVEAHPRFELPPWLLATAVLVVVALNVAAAGDNARRLWRGERDAPRDA